MKKGFRHWKFIIISGILISLFPIQEEKALSIMHRKNRYQRSHLTYDESEALADKRSLLLTTGEDKPIDLDFEVNAGANGIAYGNPTIVATTLVKLGEKRQLVFKPLKAGETTVTVRDNDGTIRLIFFVRVTGSSLLRIAGEIRSLLRDVEGLDIRIVGSKVVIEGDVIVPADYGKLYVVATDKAYSDYIINMASLSPLTMQTLAQKIQGEITALGANVRSRVVNGVIVLDGTVDDDNMLQKILKIANLYLPEMKPSSLLERDPTVQKVQGRQLLVSQIVVTPRPPKKADKLVRVTVHFVELTKDYNKLFGFKWSPGFTSDPQISVGQSTAGGVGATGTTAGSGISFTGTISSLIPKLQGAQTAGYARVLKTGTIVVRSGQPAKINEQSDIAYPQLGQNGQVTSSKVTVGLAMAVTPLIVGQTEDIQMDLELDQTDVVGKAPTTGGAPTTAIHKISTKLYVKSNESAAVGGVMSTDVGTDFNKDDPLPGSFNEGTIPLFSLLRSKSYRKKKAQFVIFVTPQIIENASEGTEDLKKNFRMKIN